MKLKVYEVERIRDDGSDEHRLQFLYLDYADAVAKFKELIEEEKKIDWIEEALTTEDDKYYEVDLSECVDYWGIYVSNMLDRMYSEVKITTREVF